MTRTSQRFLSGLFGAVLAFVCMAVTKCAIDRERIAVSAADVYIERHIRALARRDGE